VQYISFNQVMKMLHWCKYLDHEFNYGSDLCPYPPQKIHHQTKYHLCVVLSLQNFQFIIPAIN